MSRPELLLKTIVSVPFEENTYIAQIKGRADCLVIDPGLEPEKIIDYLQAGGLIPGAILNTHGHSDHIAGNAALKEIWPDCPLVIGTANAPKLTDPRQNLSRMFGANLVSPAADVTVDDGAAYSAAGFDLRVLGLPGHTVGHVAFLWEAHDPPIVFVGDVIFAGSVGRTDFPDGNFQQLRDGIHGKLFTLPGATVLLPGHGPPTTVEQEKYDNPFVGLRTAEDHSTRKATLTVTWYSCTLPLAMLPCCWTTSNQDNPQTLGSFGHGVGRRFGERIGRSADQLDFLEDGVCHERVLI